MKILREDARPGGRDVQSLVVLMIGCLCTDFEGREMVIDFVFEFILLIRHTLDCFPFPEYLYL